MSGRRGVGGPLGIEKLALCNHVRAHAHTHTHTHFARSLGGVHGIPKVHYKGRQGDYYVMVRCGARAFARLPSARAVCARASWYWHMHTCMAARPATHTHTHTRATPR